MDELARQQLAAILESSDAAIIRGNLDGIITTWNRAAELMFGYAAAEAIGAPIGLIIAPEAPEAPERPQEEADVLVGLGAGAGVS